MLASIVPLGERARNRRWGITVTAYITGSVVAATLLGGVFGLVGSPLLDGPAVDSRLALAIVAVLCAAGAAVDTRLGGLSLPTVHRQVDEDWLHRYRGWVYGFGFGFQLGLGFATIVTTAAVYLAFLLAFLSGSWQSGAVVGAAFGLARALPVLAMAKVSTPGRMRDVHRVMQERAPLAARATVGVQCAVAVVWMAAAVTR
jgi:sulfite exporter TauE/SafE